MPWVNDLRQEELRVRGHQLTVHPHLAVAATQESATEIKEALSELRNVVFCNISISYTEGPINAPQQCRVLIPAASQQLGHGDLLCVLAAVAFQGAFGRCNHMKIPVIPFCCLWV